MGHTVFNEFLSQLALQTVNLKTDTLKVALFPATFVADRDAHMHYSDIAAEEVTGTGYDAGGKILTNVDVLKQDDADNVKVQGDDITWPASTITARYAVIYKEGATPEESPLIMCFDFSTAKSSSNGDFTIQWAADGIFTISQAV